jgi:pimeloyl-[acyl-carrier protein] methyl ester esterase
MRLVLLPGLDGTGTLFAPFTAAAPPDVALTIVPLPEWPSEHAALAAALTGRVPLDADTVLLAESFAGPLALRLARQHEPAAVVLVNSFVRAPLPAAACRLVPPALFAVPMPDVVLRHWLLGAAATPALLGAFRTALARVPARVLAARVRALASLDAAADAAHLTCPLLYLRGTSDRLVRERSVRELQTRAPSMEVARVPGPHLLLQAAPELAWAALEPYLYRWAADKRIAAADERET